MNVPERPWTYPTWARFQRLTDEERTVVEIAAESSNPDMILYGAFGGYSKIGATRHDALLQAVRYLWNDRRREAA